MVFSTSLNTLKATFFMYRWLVLLGYMHLSGSVNETKKIITLGTIEHVRSMFKSIQGKEFLEKSNFLKAITKGPISGMGLLFKLELALEKYISSIPTEFDQHMTRVIMNSYGRYAIMQDLLKDRHPEVLDSLDKLRCFALFVNDQVVAIYNCNCN